jgi:hypothetical protein
MKASGETSVAAPARGIDIDMRVILEQPSGKHFGELDQVAERIAEECEAATDCGQHERLGDDRHAARAQLLDGPSTLDTFRQKW